MTEQFVLLHSARRVVWVAFGIALLGVVFARAPYMRMMFAGALFASVVIAGYLRLTRPVLTVDPSGYWVTVRSHVVVKVAWDEVTKVRIDPDNQAAYVDCGDRARNLFVPPRFGSPFTYSARERLYERVANAVPERTEVVPGLVGQAVS